MNISPTMHEKKNPSLTEDRNPARGEDMVESSSARNLHPK